MSKTRAFQCPNCGASLDYGGADLTIECPYCHTAVIVPEELRDRKPAAPEVDVMPFFGSLAEQAEYLYHVPTGRRYPIGRFHSPEAYTGEWRCDLHARFSPKGDTVVFDSTHGGDGRQVYLVDIGGFIGRAAV